MAGHVWELIIPLFVVIVGIVTWTAQRFARRFLEGLRGQR